MRQDGSDQIKNLRMRWVMISMAFLATLLNYLSGEWFTPEERSTASGIGLAIILFRTGNLVRSQELYESLRTDP